MLSMREFLKSSGRWVRDGWFWPLVLLALPNCGLYKSGLPPNPFAFPTDFSAGDLVMCDIKEPVPDGETDCAKDDELTSGIQTTKAAVSLFAGKSQALALDYSPDALNHCSMNPRKIKFLANYPDGLPVCVNCGTQKPNPFSDGNAVCVAMCKDKLSAQMDDPTDYCNTPGNAQVSTNFNPAQCFLGLCNNNTPAGNLSMIDPRRPQEPLIWTTQNGTMGGANGSSIHRTAGRSGSFDAGAFSDKQIITHGDGWVEFSVSNNQKAYAFGLSLGETDSDETTADIKFGFIMNPDQTFSIKDGDVVTKIRSYLTSERFRIRFVDLNDGNKGVVLSASTGVCNPGAVCNDATVALSSLQGLTYPLRVDVSLLDDTDAEIQNATMVRIQDFK